MAAAVAEEFAHGAAGIGCEELQRCRIRRGSSHNDGIFHGVIVGQRLDELSNRGTLLTDGDIDAIELRALILAFIDGLLVQDGVDDDGGLAGLTVTNDQLTLATTNRDQAVDCLEAGLHRLMNRFTRDNARCLDFNALAGGTFNRAFAVDRVAEAVNDAAKKAFANRNVNDGAGPLDGVAFLNAPVIAEDNDTDIVAFQVERHTFDAAREFNHFTGTDLIQAVHTGDAVTD